MSDNHATFDPRLRWFDSDPPAEPGQALTSDIWSHEISLQLSTSRSDFERRNPQIVFIKQMKVGGTSVALALDGAANFYNTTNFAPRVPQPSAMQTLGLQVPCTQTGSLYYHHGFRSAWMETCIPSARYITVFRDPVEQVISWAGFEKSRYYYYTLDSRKYCSQEELPDMTDFNHSDTRIFGKSINNAYALLGKNKCNNTEEWHKVVVQFVKHLAKEMAGAVLSYRWLTGLMDGLAVENKIDFVSAFICIYPYYVTCLFQLGY
jgi:hypothetical protein